MNCESNWYQDARTLISADVRRPREAQPDLPVLRSADDDRAPPEEAVDTRRRPQGRRPPALLPIELVSDGPAIVAPFSSWLLSELLHKPSSPFGAPTCIAVSSLVIVTSAQ